MICYAPTPRPSSPQRQESSVTEVFTTRDAIQRSSEWLKSRGIDSPRLDAELLLAKALNCERLDLFMAPDRPLDEEETDRYRALIQRRGAHEPVAYILGDIGFWKYDFNIDKRALIPRPETEGILDAVLKAVGTQRDAALRIVDVGTGSGVLAVSLALQFPNAQVVAIDVSEDALSLTKENAERHDVSNRVHPVRGDLLAPLIARGSKSDIIVSNPPYVGESERRLMSQGVEEWEPYHALFGGKDGFDVIDRLLTQIPQTLALGGLFVMEFGSPQGDGIRARAQRMFRQWRVLKDYSQHDRLLVVDGPGERSWYQGPETDEARSGDAASKAEAVDEATGQEATIDPVTARNEAMRYGGASGEETLPEIDLNEDLD